MTITTAINDVRWIIMQDDYGIKTSSIIRCNLMFETENKNTGSRRESNPGHLACAASILPLSYDNWTATNPHNSLYMHTISGCLVCD